MNNTKQLNQLKDLYKALPSQKLAEKMLKKIWKKKTKCLDNPQQNKKQIKKLITEQTKKIKYKNKTTHDWLNEIINTEQTTKEQQQFIKWYKTEYPIISLNTLF